MYSLKSMSKDTSCTTIVLVDDYIKKHYPGISYEEVFKEIIVDEEFFYVDSTTGKLSPVTIDYLLNPEHWISNKLLNSYFTNVVSLLKDNKIIYKAGKDFFKSKITARHILVRFVDPRVIFSRAAKENDKFNRNKRVEVVQNQKGYAVIRLYWEKDPALTKYSCDMNRGIYESFGTIMKQDTSLEETSCFFEGGDYCEYHVRYKSSTFFPRIWNTCKYLVSRDIVNMLEQKIEEITNIQINQERIIEQRTKELEDIQSKLLITEKRVLEQRITGGFAHEMRNALTGAQLEMKAVLDYREQGKGAPEVIKEAATNLLKQIKDLQTEYQIPKDQIAQTLIPPLKEIAQVIEFLSETHRDVYHDLERGLSITSQ
ncbi:MAG: hypothetical protein C0407_11420, partial [Desulfobacca sp.]|nr:hypothetical protein [Desulfobacca sp.]